MENQYLKAEEFYKQAISLLENDNSACNSRFTKEEDSNLEILFLHQKV